MSYPGFGASGGGGGTRNIDMSRSRRLSYKLELEADKKARTETDLAINIRKATSIGELLRPLQEKRMRVLMSV